MNERVALNDRGVGKSVALVAFLAIMVGFAILAANFITNWSAGLINAQLRPGVINVDSYVKEGRIHLKIKNVNGEAITIVNIIINKRMPEGFEPITVEPGQLVDIALEPEKYGFEGGFESGVIYEVKIDTATYGYFIVSVRV